MANRKKAAASQVNVVNAMETDLGAVREKFEELKNLATKLPEGKSRVQILHGIETLYISTVNWITGGFVGTSAFMHERDATA